MGLNKVIPPRVNKFGILLCSCPSLGIWLTVGVMTYSARRSLWTQICPLPNKKHPISAQHKPCTQSGLSFDPSCTSWSNSVLCITHAKTWFSHLSPDQVNVCQCTVIAVAVFLYDLNWICTIYTIICYAHVRPSWPYFWLDNWRQEKCSSGTWCPKWTCLFWAHLKNVGLIFCCLWLK